MRGIKIPPQYFALKMQGRLMREGGRICGTLRYMCMHVSTANSDKYKHMSQYKRTPTMKNCKTKQDCRVNLHLMSSNKSRPHLYT